MGESNIWWNPDYYMDSISDFFTILSTSHRLYIFRLFGSRGSSNLIMLWWKEEFPVGWLWPPKSSDHGESIGGMG